MHVSNVVPPAEETFLLTRDVMRTVPPISAELEGLDMPSVLLMTHNQWQWLNRSRPTLVSVTPWSLFIIKLYDFNKKVNLKIRAKESF
jgi:hypothetical protein